MGLWLAPPDDPGLRREDARCQIRDRFRSPDLHPPLQHGEIPGPRGTPGTARDVGIDLVTRRPDGLAVEASRERDTDRFAVHVTVVAEPCRSVPGPANRIARGPRVTLTAVDDLTLLARDAGRGDRQALVGFVRDSQPEVWRVCARLGDRSDADDLTQEVYARAIPALARFRADSSARTWLLQIARHVCADHVRRRTRRRALLDRLQASRVTEVEVSDDAHGRLELDELIRGLRTERREAFVLTQLAGLSYGEAATVCGVPVGTIRSRVARARADLLAELADESVAS